jgi:hypothetical protein
MRYIIAIVSATALAVLSSVVCGYFANDPAKGISTGFSQGELKVIPWIVFIITMVSISKAVAKAKPKEPQIKNKINRQNSGEVNKKESENTCD